MLQLERKHHCITELKIQNSGGKNAEDGLREREGTKENYVEKV